MSNFPATQPTLVMPFSGMDTPTRMNQLLDSWGATFTRATTATLVNKLGQIETVASGLPRPNFDPVTKENKGILIEEERANLLQRSEEFDNAYWTNASARATVTANQIASPDGNVTADEVTADSTSENRQERILTVTAGNHTFSFWAKNNDSDWVHGIVLDNVATAGARQWFNISSGSVGTSTTFGSGYSVSTATIEEYPNGWYRCSMSVDVPDTSIRVGISISSGDGVTSAVIGESAYLWGAQLEEGSFPTSYIPTISSSVTRNKEDLIHSGTSFTDLLNSQEGALLLEFFQANNTSTERYLASIHDNTANEQINMYLDGSEQVVSNVLDGGASQASFTSSAVSLSAVNKAMFYFKANSFNQAVNGTAGTADTSGTIPTVNQLNIGSAFDESKHFNGEISRLVLYPDAVTDIAKLTRTTA